jgi:hypothetical protein
VSTNGSVRRKGGKNRGRETLYIHIAEKRDLIFSPQACFSSSSSCVQPNSLRTHSLSGRSTSSHSAATSTRLIFLPFPVSSISIYVFMDGCMHAHLHALTKGYKHMYANICTRAMHMHTSKGIREPILLWFPHSTSNIVQVWVPLFFSAPLVDLPLVLVKTPPDQLAKVILVIIVGTIFSILSSSFIVEAIMRVTAPTQDTAQVPARINLDKAARFSIHLTEFKTGATPGVR